MLVLFLYGFGLIYVLSGMMGYNLAFHQVLMISVISFTIIKTFLRNKKTSGITIVSVLVLLIASGVILHYSDNLLMMIDLLSDFIEPYRIAISGVTIELTGLHKMIVLSLIGVAVYKIVDEYHDLKYSYIVFIVVSIIVVTYGFVEIRLSSTADRLPLVVLFLGSFVFYFYTYYKEEKKQENSPKEGRFRHYLTIVAYYLIAVVVVAYSLYTVNPFPFYQEVRSFGEVEEEEDRTEERYRKLLKASGAINDKFVFAGRELLQIKSTETKYIKGFTYEVFDGEWHQNEKSDVFSSTDLTPYGVYDEVEIHYTRLRTPAYFTSGFHTLDFQGPAEANVEYDEGRNTYQDNQYDLFQKGNAIYSYKAVLVESKSPDFVSFLKSSNNDMNISKTVYELPRGYDYIQDMADTIVEGEETDYDKTMAVIDYLRNNYTYNVEPVLPINHNEDRINFFLNTSLEGFCQHYATSAILMLRSQGIPARYVTGYLVNYKVDLDGVGLDQELMAAMAAGRFQVKDSDAHTWMEVYFKDIGWIPFETTGVSEVGFTPTPMSELMPVIEETSEQLSSDGLKLVGYGVVLLIVLFLLGLLIRLIVRVAKRKKYYKKSDSTNQSVILFKLILGYLKTIKLTKNPDETYREFASRVDELPISDIPLGQLILQYEGYLYGGKSLNENSKETLLSFLEDVRTSSKNYAGLFSRLNMQINDFASR